MRNSLAVAVAAALAAATPLAANAANTGDGTSHHLATPAVSAAAATKHRAAGVVRRVDATRGTVMIAHEPIVSLGWPAMTMAFQVRDPRLLGKLRAGNAVEFEFEQTNDGYRVTAVK